ncbi:DUF4124 domain-containing protein [Pseudomonas sp. DC3000-4b1]|uniref:DUF4124 domain-containing protein n=1 Tax=unclassified Pseudomonas TaxID=196821 RepID=UPI003CF8FEBB
MRALALVSLIFFSGLAWSQVYTYVDAQGNRVYTDQPRKGATPVKVPEGNRISPPPAKAAASAPAAPPGAARPIRPARMVHYEMFRILVPLPEASVVHASGEMIVTLTSEPGLAEGHAYRVILDGAPASQPSASPVVPLQNVDRGAHLLSAEILDAQGTVVERTPAQPVYMKRASLAQKRRVRPCKEADYGVRPECPLSDKPADDDEGS